MLSPTINAEIKDLTAEVLAAVPGKEAVERITIVRAYRYLSEKYPDQKDLEDRLAKAVRDLSRLVQRNGTPTLAAKIETLYNSIVKDRRSPTLSASAAGTR